ncbi:YicC family protein [Metabacillus endolithicus]|nr:YicC/YloC family endoribonuclease [Metabacillus endolithicus]UPG63212.1 YicC family protein [Metabacillus endolithicus]
MVLSMTGFGRSSGQIQSCLFTVEMKSVNHRFLDIHIKMPKQLLSIEDKIKKLISTYISRGRIEVYINLEGELQSSKTIHIDWGLLDQYTESLQQIKKRFSINDDLSLNHILSLGEGMEIREEALSSDEVEDELIQLAEVAVKQLADMRKVEGEQLALDINKRLDLLAEINADLQNMAPLVVDQYRERISKRVFEFVSGKIDETRILTEVALFADKVDISEEIIRIHSHVHQFKQTLQTKEPVGRKLDFIVQELNREANTIGSKANDGAIAKNVVELKSIIEKLKEQVQNIE